MYSLLLTGFSGERSGLLGLLFVEHINIIHSIVRIVTFIAKMRSQVRLVKHFSTPEIIPENW